jgi:hypothetical protein
MLGLLIIDCSARFPRPDVLLQKLAFLSSIWILRGTASGFRRKFLAGEQESSAAQKILSLYFEMVVCFFHVFTNKYTEIT